MSIFGTGPKWSSGQRSGAVRVWPGGIREGSTPSGTRFRLKNDAIPAEYRDAVILACQRSVRRRGPVAQLGERVNRTHEARGSNPLGSTTSGLAFGDVLQLVDHAAHVCHARQDRDVV